MRLLKQGLALFLAGLALPFSALSGGVVTTPTIASFNAAMSGGGIVTFAVDANLVLPSGYNINSTNITIDAAGHSVTLSGGNSIQLFSIDSGFTLTLVGVDIINCQGTGNGGAIDNRGTFIATNCFFSTNLVVGAAGATGLAGGSGSVGGIGGAGTSVGGGFLYNESGASATFYSCAFQGNTATGGNGGTGGRGGDDSNIAGDGGIGGAAGTANGGAIKNLGTLQITYCLFVNNTVYGGTGGAGGNGGDGGNQSGSGGNGNIGTNAYGGQFLIRAASSSPTALWWSMERWAAMAVGGALEV